MGKRDFARFEFEMRFGRISFSATARRAIAKRNKPDHTMCISYMRCLYQFTTLLRVRSVSWNISTPMSHGYNMDFLEATYTFNLYNIAVKI